MDIEIYNGYKKIIENLINNGHLPSSIDMDLYIRRFGYHYGCMMTDDCEEWVDTFKQEEEEKREIGHKNTER